MYHWCIFQCDLVAVLLVRLWDNDLRIAALLAVHLVVFCLELRDEVTILNWHE